MIRNMEDEKKNMRRRDSDSSGYLSDGELSGLIRIVEEKEMLHAPAHLKGNVMAKIRRDRHNARIRQVFVYRAKILTAMAAALAVLVLMPADRTEREGQVFVEQQAGVALEQMALERQRDIDENWEKYLGERENGRIRGFFRDINEKITGLEIRKMTGR